MLSVFFEVIIGSSIIASLHDKSAGVADKFGFTSFTRIGSEILSFSTPTTGVLLSFVSLQAGTAGAVKLTGFTSVFSMGV